MAQIPGSVRVTGIIAPTDSTDTYAVTDTQYGLDGLRNFTGTTSDLDSITAQRRRAGMIAGVLSGGTRLYFRLNPEPWNFDSTDWTRLTLYDWTGSTSFTQVESQYWVSGGTGTGLLNVGSGHSVLGEYSIAGGGTGNTVNGNFSVAIGGIDNVVSAATNFISSAAIAGSFNLVQDGVVIGGFLNTASTGSLTSVIAGGIVNQNVGITSFIGGGSANYAAGQQIGMLGGSNNRVTNTNTAVIGGIFNSGQSQSSAIIAGQGNVVQGTNSAIVGGQGNQVVGVFGSAVGGAGLIVSGYGQTVVGVNNVAQGEIATQEDYNYLFVIGGGKIADSSRVNSFAVRQDGAIQTRPFTGGTLPTTGIQEGALAFSGNTGLYQFVNGAWTGFTSGTGGGGGSQTWQETISQGNIVTAGSPTLSGEGITYRPAVGATTFQVISPLNNRFHITGSTGYGMQMESKHLRYINENEDAYAQLGIETGGEVNWTSRNGTYTGTLEVTHSLSANRTWRMPDESGTIALISDVTGATGNTGGAPQTLTMLPTTVWDLDFGHNARVTLTGDTTFSITNINSGDYGTVVVTQDATGGHSITPPGSSLVVNGAGGVLNLTSNPGAIDVLTFYYDGTTYYWNLGGDYT